jgi:hypothetical protein
MTEIPKRWAREIGSGTIWRSTRAIRRKGMMIGNLTAVADGLPAIKS